MTYFIFVIHFHQPVGQLKYVLERVQKKCYEMLLRVFKDFKNIPLTLHFSGPLLLEWEEKFPEYLKELRCLIKGSSFEVIGGTYSESILTLLPYKDRLWQVIEGRELVVEMLGVEPKGLWLPERVWDPTLPSVIAEAGYEYVIVDDEVGYRAKLWKGDVHRAWNTEYDGKIVKVLFIDATIRELLPWRSHSEVLNYLKQFKEPEYVLWGSDAEKFGEWWDSKSAESWLRYFLSNIPDWVKVVTPSRYLIENKVSGLVYLPPGSYNKMMEWSGGFFPTFLRKYIESNNMHKKMLYVRKKLERANVSETAWKYYYLAQCNDAYWHGLFGGIYIPSLRGAIYSNLIKAERLIQDEEYKVLEFDFDLDGWREVIIEAPFLNLYLKPSDGGTLFELDLKVEGYEANLLNTLTRVLEPYLEGTGFKPDWYRRVAFREHVWKPWVRLEDWIWNTPFADSSDFALGKYLYGYVSRGLRLTYLGRNWDNGGKRIFIEKVFKVEPDKPVVRVYLSWRNMEKEKVFLKLSEEIHLLPPLPNSSSVTPYYIVDGEYSKSFYESHVSPWSKRVELKSGDYPSIVVEQDKRGELWVAPVLSLNRTEKGIFRTLQGLGLSFNHSVSLNPGESFDVTFTLSVEVV
ncbi:MAG TPA: DUF1925 domain-containing protein [Thermoproteales archaeon]|nr:DUF1925 domain-containing protein [Thermoproteales archaeon]